MCVFTYSFWFPPMLPFCLALVYSFLHSNQLPTKAKQHFKVTHKITSTTYICFDSYLFQIGLALEKAIPTLGDVNGHQSD